MTWIRRKREVAEGESREGWRRMVTVSVRRSGLRVGEGSSSK